MPRQGELTYYSRLGDEGRRITLSKPFTFPDCGVYLQRVGVLFQLLPPPPARVLECGCGTGWLSYLLARHGYDVTGTDVAPDAIQLARENPMFCDGVAPDFQVADTESLAFDAEFDAVVFYDSLHHSVDERAALRSAYRALRPGGACIALEPGRGHHKKSLDVEAEHDVTEKDMPPSYVGRLGREVGFRRMRVVPAPQHLAKVLYASSSADGGWRSKLLSIEPFRTLAALYVIASRHSRCGVTVLHK